MTLAIVNFVNRIHRCQLLGMVAEVIESDEGVQLLTGILGCCWPDQWARRRVLHPDGALSAASPPAVKPRPSGGRASLNVANDGGALPGLNVPGGKRSTGSLVRIAAMPRTCHPWLQDIAIPGSNPQIETLHCHAEHPRVMHLGLVAPSSSAATLHDLHFSCRSAWTSYIMPHSFPSRNKDSTI